MQGCVHVGCMCTCVCVDTSVLVEHRRHRLVSSSESLPPSRQGGSRWPLSGNQARLGSQTTPTIPFSSAEVASGQYHTWQSCMGPGDGAAVPLLAWYPFTSWTILSTVWLSAWFLVLHSPRGKDTLQIDFLFIFILGWAVWYNYQFIQSDVLWVPPIISEVEENIQVEVRQEVGDVVEEKSWKK